MLLPVGRKEWVVLKCLGLIFRSHSNSVESATFNTEVKMVFKFRLFSSCQQQAYKSVIGAEDIFKMSSVSNIKLESGRNSLRRTLNIFFSTVKITSRIE